MSGNEIRENPSLSELKKQADQLKAFRRAWPILKPFARLLRADTKSIDSLLGQVSELANQVDEMIIIPDRFNDVFSDRGWILFDSMDLTVAKRAIEIAETEGIDQAEVFLVDSFSPEWVESRINWLRHIKGFRERFAIAKLALDDYMAGRYYASVLVTLALIDGWVSELNIIDFQRQGFFSEKSRLIAWDSVAAHPKGLVKLQDVFGRSRMMTRTEEIQIPYRHGIVHGMDLGYNNKYVAAKCWAALFAVRDWAIKVAKNELHPPEPNPKAEKTLWESIENYQRVLKERQQLEQWVPRKVVVGKSIPTSGQPQDYPSGTPEHKIVEFLHYWLKRNYGYMAKCYAPFLEMQPVNVRDTFAHKRLMDFELIDVKEISPGVADVVVKLQMQVGDNVSNVVYEFRLVLNNTEKEIEFFAGGDAVWGVATWRTV